MISYMLDCHLYFNYFNFSTFVALITSLRIGIFNSGIITGKEYICISPLLGAIWFVRFFVVVVVGEEMV